MAYTWYIDDALLDQYDYVSADEILKRVTEASLGRCYVDEEGNLVYETRNVRTV